MTDHGSRLEGWMVWFKRKRITLVVSLIALAGIAMIPNGARAGDDDREWWEKSHCLGLEGISRIECQKALSQKKRDRKEGLPPADRPEWWEKSRCLGLEGISWIECQKALSQKKRDRKEGLPPADRPEWWEKSRCLGLEGISWIECQKALKQKKRERK